MPEFPAPRYAHGRGVEQRGYFPKNGDGRWVNTLEKEFKAAKTPQEKEKIKKMAEACKKMANAYFDSIDAAKVKDANEMAGLFKTMGL